MGAKSGAARAEQGFWVVVLPFKCGSGNPDLLDLADGLSEDIVTGLSRFSDGLRKAGLEIASAKKSAGNLRS